MVTNADTWINILDHKKKPVRLRGIINFRNIVMPKKYIQRVMPDHDVIKSHKHLQFLGDRLHEPNLWHLNRHSVSKAFAIGLFAAWIPGPGQMAIAAIAAFYCRANLPISVALVWITNPVTMPPMFYFAYRVGLAVLGLPGQGEFEYNLESFLASLDQIWFPLLFGSLVVGTVSSAIGYAGIQMIWRQYTIKKWEERAERRQADRGHG